MESAKVVGYGPKSSVFPCIPEFLVVESHGSNHRLAETGEVTPASLDEEIEAVLYPVELKPDQWCVVEEDRTLTWFPKDGKKKLIDKRAKALVREAKTGSNPLKSVDMLKAAAKMCGFELTELLETLEDCRKNPSESLEQIFKRLKTEMPRQG